MKNAIRTLSLACIAGGILALVPIGPLAASLSAVVALAGLLLRGTQQMADCGSSPGLSAGPQYHRARYRLVWRQDNISRLLQH
jgi:hypothetical protein